MIALSSVSSRVRIRFVSSSSISSVVFASSFERVYVLVRSCLLLRVVDVLLVLLSEPLS